MRRIITTIAALAAFGIAGSAQATVLSWTDSAFTDSAQVSAEGTGIYAYNFGTSTDVAVNGVLFEGSTANQAGSALDDVQWGANDAQVGNTDTGYASLGVTGLSATDEVELLNWAVYGDNEGVGFALEGLSIGQSYSFQALVVDNRGFAADRLLHFSNDDTTWDGALVDYTSNGSPAYAWIVETTFTADAATQGFRTGIQGVGEMHFNAFQLRAIPEPATLGMVGFFGAALLVVRRKLMM